jgi:uncharacterized protein YbjQ (UPF0145 family)
MNMRISSFLPLAVMALISGCASGSVIVTGTTRPAVRAAAVKIYLDPPAEFETIGLVRASSSSGWTQQGDLDYAVKELRRRAGKMGANGVLLSSSGSKITGIVGGTSGGVVYATPVAAQAVEGRAIYVSREK